MAASSGGEELNSNVLEGLLSATEKLDNLEALDADYNAFFVRREGSFKTKMPPDSVEFEFDLPQVEDMPTLESILNEKDSDLLHFESDPDLNMILEEDISPMNLDLQSEMQKRKDKKTHGSILRHVMLKNVSGQMVSASARVEAGLPTSMAVSMLVAIGTSHGIVLVFDPQQTLKLVLGTTAVGAEYGAVTALGFNMDCTRLLVGHAKGQITMWDLSSGACLRKITDAHAQGSAVLHVMFTDDPTVAICSDSGGSVFVLSFKRVIGLRTYETRCLFSGSRGEVCTMAPLHMMNVIKDHPLLNVSMLALATLTKVLVLSLKPRMEVLFSAALKGPSDCLPIIAWQFAIIQTSESTKVVNPVLAFGRGSNIYFFQGRYHEEKLAKFSYLHKIETSYSIISFQWMNPQIIAIIDTFERIHLVDVKSSEELEVLDLGNVRLVYASSYFKSLSTGGNVSKALVVASEHACYQSVVVFKGQLLLLGVKSVHVLTLRTWKDRIAVYVRQNQFLDALDLALSFYNGTAKAIVGLFGSVSKRKRFISDEIVDLLLAYVDLSLAMNCPNSGDDQEIRTFFMDLVTVCIDYCLAVQRIDILFHELYDKFAEDTMAQGAFLECLEPYILSDKVTSLSPVVMKDFVEYYQGKGKLKEVESCIVHLDVLTMDIHQTVVLCWTHGLYDAIIHIYNRGMNDFTTPVEELCSVLQSSLRGKKPLSDLDQMLGYKLCLYISCCLAGRAYPVGNIPQQMVKYVRTQVLECIIARHSKDGDETGELLYPYLRSLLHFDTREFLNVLSLSFEEPSFDEDTSVPGQPPSRQRVVNILLDIMVQDMGFSPMQVGCLFIFLAREMAKHNEKINVSTVLFEQVLEYLTNADDDARHEERQQALFELLNSGGLRSFDEDRILALAENARFYRVCELLYERRRQYAKILSCYFRDPSRKEKAFSYILMVMMEDNFTDLERDEVQRATLDSLEELVSINSRSAAHMILKVFQDSLPDVVSKLEAGKLEMLYDFLKGVFDFKGLSLFKQDKPPPPEVHEKYIELICRFEPHLVYTYLRGTEVAYRTEQTLEISRRYRVTDATAYLLEKSGDIQGAFQMLLDNLKEKVKILRKIFTNSGENQTPESNKALSAVRASLLVIIQMCQRNSSKYDEPDREALWFPLLEVVMTPQQQMKDTTGPQFLAFKDLTRHVLNSMMGYIALPAILQKIMQDPTYSSGKFGEVKELILGMLDTYSYEVTLLTTTNQLLGSDLHWSLSNLKSSMNHGLAPINSHCGVCEQIFVNQTSADIAIFKCQHAHHAECLQALAGTGGQWLCVLCNQSQFNKPGVREKEGKQQSQVGQSSSKGTIEFGGKKLQSDNQQTSLTPEQKESVNRLRRHMKGPSRLAILADLSRLRDSDTIGQLSYMSSSSRGILQDDSFRLRLAPPT